MICCDVEFKRSKSRVTLTVTDIIIATSLDGQLHDERVSFFGSLNTSALS